MTDFFSFNETTSAIYKDIAKEFYSLRNGIISETLRKSGIPHKYIWGLQLVQIADVSKRYSKDNVLADELWNHNESREARLLAIHLFNPETIAQEKAMKLIEEVLSREEAEILAFKLLKYLPYAKSLLESEWLRTDKDIIYSQYCLEMLRKNLIAMGIIA